MNCENFDTLISSLINLVKELWRLVQLNVEALPEFIQT